MARIPLLECLTRHSYRESIEKSSSTQGRDSDETEEEKASDSVLCPTDALRQKSPAATTGEAASEREELSDSGGLRALLDDEAPECSNPPCFNVTLLDWINVQDRPNDVESVVRKCFDSINRVSDGSAVLSKIVVAVYLFIIKLFMFLPARLSNYRPLSIGLS